MRAAMCRSHGAPEAVTVEDIPDPVPGPDEVRVSVAAAAVNFPDVLLAANEYQVHVPVPFVVGSELAGRVDEVGTNVRELRVGDRVFGATMVGAFAEKAVVHAAGLSRTPDGVDDASAAAFGVAHRTAYHALRSVASVQSGDEVIVLGAGGGVGLAAVQVATVLGASVTAIASSDEKLDVAKACGATRTVQPRAGELRAQLREVLPEGADVVLDPVGGDVAEPALRALRWGGRFVTVGYASGEIPRIPLNLVLLKGVTILGYDARSFMTHDPERAQRDERELMDLLAAGDLKPHIGARFTLDDTPAALRYVADRRAIGKVVIDVRPPVTPR